MYQLHELRQKYGISLSEMAEYLDVSKSMAAKAEKMERTLPLMADLKLLALKGAASMHDERRNNTQPSLRQQQHGMLYSYLLTELERRIIKCKLKAIKLEGKLKKLMASYPATADFMELTDHLPQFITGDTLENKKEQVWLQDMKEAANLKLKKCDIEAQMEIRIGIGMLEAEQVVLQENIIHIHKLLLEITPSGEMDATLQLPARGSQLHESAKATVVKQQRKKK